MRRREFITLAGNAMASPLAALAQQPSKIHRISYLASTRDRNKTLGLTDPPRPCR